MKKSLIYAYGTSPYADRFNNGRGIWLINVNREVYLKIDDKWEALMLFQEIDLPIETFSSFTIERDTFNPSTR